MTTDRIYHTLAMEARGYDSPKGEPESLCFLV